MFPSLSTNTGNPEPFSHHVREADVSQRQVDGDHRRAGATVDQCDWDPEPDCRQSSEPELPINSSTASCTVFSSARLVETGDGPLHTMVDSSTEPSIDRTGR